MKPRHAPPPVVADFAGGLRRPNWIGWLLLGFGLAAAAGVLHEYDVLETRVAEESHALVRAKRSLDGSLGATASPRAPVSEQELKPALALARVLNRDWKDLLTTLEAAADDPGVALLSVDQEGARGGLKLAGEARNLPEVFAFVKRLEAGGVLRDARLSGYEFHMSGPAQVVGFTVQARWEGAQ